LRLIAAALLAAASFAAHAQFGGFSIPGFGGFGKGGGTPFDAGKLIDKIGQATKEIDEPTEIKIGAEFAAILLGAKPLDTDLRLQRYVNLLGRWLALQTDRPDLPWTFGVLKDEGFNAFATPGGNIFVTSGLVKKMRSEAELAGVLAHEIAHVLKKHHLKAVQKKAGLDVFADLAECQVQKGGSALGGQFKSMMLNAGREMYAKGLDKDDEYESDRVGVLIAAKAGFDPYGLPAVLQTIQAQNAEDDAFSLLFSTHPDPAERIETLDKWMGTRFDSLPRKPDKTVAQRIKEVASAK
jgi:predicted Zn-dependent protease